MSQNREIGSLGQVLTTNLASNTVSFDSAISADFLMNKLTISQNYTLPADTGATVVGPITVANGVTLTVPDGSRLIII
jgi:hypothetical protein